MFGSGITDILKELDQIEGSFDIPRSKAQVLVVPPGILIIQVDVEEFSSFPRLGDTMHKVQPSHVLMSNFGIDTYHLGVIERGNEAKHVTNSGVVNISPRLVRFGFQGKFQAVAIVQVVFTQEIQRFAVALDRIDRAFAAVGFGFLTPIPSNTYDP